MLTIKAVAFKQKFKRVFFQQLVAFMSDQVDAVIKPTGNKRKTDIWKSMLNFVYTFNVYAYIK